jgi:hypothetical protein
VSHRKRLIVIAVEWLVGLGAVIATSVEHARFF